MGTRIPEFGPSRACIAPWLSVRHSAEAVDYYRAAFGAVVLERLEDAPGHLVVAHLSVGGADFWLQEDPDGSPPSTAGGPVRMILTVDEPDPVFHQAVHAGATIVAAIDEDHGWRIGRIADPFGHHWEIGRPLVRGV